MDYFGSSEVGASTSTTIDNNLQIFNMNDDKKNYRKYLECDSTANLSFNALINDLLGNYSIDECKSKEKIEEWIEESNLFYNSRDKGIIPKLLEDAFLYGTGYYQIYKTNKTINQLNIKNKFHRLDPFSTYTIENPFNNEEIIIHEFQKDYKNNLIVFCENSNDEDEKNKILEMKELKEKSGYEIHWQDIKNIIVFKAQSLMMGDCYNAIEKKFDLLFNLGKLIDERAVSPPVCVSVGEVMNGEPVGLPTEDNKEEYKNIIENYAKGISNIKTKGGMAVPGYVKTTAIPFKIDTGYLKTILDKCDEIICSSFYYNEAFTKSGSADYKRTDLRKQRKEFLRKYKIRIEKLINKLIDLEFENSNNKDNNINNGNKNISKFHFIIDDSEEKKELSETHEKIINCIKELKEIGASEETISNFANIYGLELELKEKEINKSNNENKNKNTKSEQYAKNNQLNKLNNKLTNELNEVDELSPWGNELLNSINTEIEKATIEVYEKTLKTSNNIETISINEYGKLKEILEKSFNKINFKKLVFENIENHLKANALPIKENKNAIEFVKNYAFDQCGKLSDDQKNRLKYIN
ncbi:hypothetical protein J2127_000515 [Methanococcus voltae]|uniref:hypothetical protein n=1 Tax=Methanococcus voltae TaxID=2188 RepID=UPI001AE6DB71|nr:hypothetical protein [Methanococcus voltae]MBP2143360.1 hypothetical protein [Methanococcus voltae]